MDSSARLALSHTSSSTSTRRRVAVIGAGIIGLSCAYRLQAELPFTQVTIMSEKFSPHLLSDGAAGIWDPYDISGTDAVRAIRWSLDTYRHLMSVGLCSDSIRSGVAPICFYRPGLETNQEIPTHLGDVFHLTSISQADKDRFPGCKGGFKFTSVMCEPKHYLPWMMNKYLAAGGKVIQKKVTSLHLICGDYDLVVNCTGWGAKELVDDTKFLPIRGQVTKVCVKVPINRGYVFVSSKESCTYVLPGRDLVTLGGTYVIGDASTDVKEEDKQHIIKETILTEPTLKDAHVVLDWCGSRPARRGGTRLEIDESFHPKTKVIHNYGHGGIGITLHWGCAAEVLDLARHEFGCGAQHRSKL